MWAFKEEKQLLVGTLMVIINLENCLPIFCVQCYMCAYTLYAYPCVHVYACKLMYTYV